MPQITSHSSARVPNEPLRVAGMTVLQAATMLASFALAAVGWWALGQLHVSGLGFFFARSITCGVVAGILGLLAYAAFDGTREPFIRQALGYPFRRHNYRREEVCHGPTVVPFPTHADAPATTKAAARLAGASSRLSAFVRFRHPSQ